MRAFYFGPPGRRLFGAYHAPDGTPVTARGVVICQPVGHEYLRTHRALRNLAALLARQGHPVLRFDYYGCGDSEGETADGTVDQWIADISVAVDELRRTARVSRVSLVGVRLGAALAARAAEKRPDVDALNLWDPVVHGRRYVEELVRMGADIHTDAHHAVVRGVPRLHGAEVCAHDIRAGAALVVAGLAADGETIVSGAGHIDRGYEDLVGKLRSLGADLERT